MSGSGCYVALLRCRRANNRVTGRLDAAAGQSILSVDEPSCDGSPAEPSFGYTPPVRFRRRFISILRRPSPDLTDVFVIQDGLSMHRLAPRGALPLERLVSPSLQARGYCLEMMLEEPVQRWFEGWNSHGAPYRATRAPYDSGEFSRVIIDSRRRIARISKSTRNAIQ